MVLSSQLRGGQIGDSNRRQAGDFGRPACAPGLHYFRPRIPRSINIERGASRLALCKKGRHTMVAATQMGESVEIGSPGLNRWWRVFGGLMMNIALGTL